MRSSPRKRELSLGVLLLLDRLWAAVSRKTQTAAAATDAFQCSKGALWSVGAGDFAACLTADFNSGAGERARVRHRPTVDMVFVLGQFEPRYGREKWTLFLLPPAEPNSCRSGARRRLPDKGVPR
jgi:hypothetical protein